RRPVPRRAGLPAAAGLALLVAGTVQVTVGTLAADGASSGDGPRAGAAPVTVVSWNLHYGVTPEGRVELEQLARTIEEQGACVVLLQEVSRGWVLGGGTDMATWLAHRLGMRASFAPAADRQFGNAVLSCVPHRDVVVHALPYGTGPQGRSAISATVELAEGPQRYTSVHLQHRRTSTPTRLDQLASLLRTGDLGVLGVIGGDLNAEPGWPELDLLEEAGFVSAQDALGDPALLTSPSRDPRYRIDWVLGPGWSDGDRLDVLVGTPWSDHLPLVLTHTPQGG
ncbi:endonuclease/exonuclease/phosphatase family protein, partial [Actinotalea ferrariae]|uniref:endonuclease/exonuclease/phosphatase family protein n=1 Tax=Actinotalea ferrariae TaxID=1386098 RepID=UPI001566A296